MRTKGNDINGGISPWIYIFVVGIFSFFIIKMTNLPSFIAGLFGGN